MDPRRAGIWRWQSTVDHHPIEAVVGYMMITTVLAIIYHYRYDMKIIWYRYFQRRHNHVQVSISRLIRWPISAIGNSIFFGFVIYRKLAQGICEACYLLSKNMSTLLIGQNSKLGCCRVIIQFRSIWSKSCNTSKSGFGKKTSRGWWMRHPYVLWSSTEAFYLCIIHLTS